MVGLVSLGLTAALQEVAAPLAVAVGPVLAGGGGVTRHAAVPPGPGADDPVDIVVLGESHHLGPGLLIRDAAGAAQVAIVRAHEGPG